VNDLNVLNCRSVRDTAHMQKVIDGPIGQELLDKVSNSPTANLIGLCWMDAGARNMYDTKRPIKDIADLKALRSRHGQPDVRRYDERSGGNGVAWLRPVFTALQPAWSMAPRTTRQALFRQHYQVAKYYTLTEHLIVPEMLVFSSRSGTNFPRTTRRWCRSLAVRRK